MISVKGLLSVVFCGEALGMSRRRAAILGMAIFAATSSQAHGQNPPPPVMTFHCSPDPVYVNSAANCQVHVGGSATGTVTLSVNGFSLATLALDSNGDAAQSTAPFGPATGLYIVQAAYSGDSQYASAQRSEGLTVYSGKVIVTSDTLTCSPYQLAPSSDSLTCALHAPKGSTGHVSFTIDGNPWITATIDANGNAVAFKDLSGYAANTLIGDSNTPHKIEANYSGDANFASFTADTFEVIKYPKAQASGTSVSCSPASVSVGTSGTCTVQVSGGASGTVDLYVHDQWVSTLTLDSTGKGVATNLFSTLPAGTYAVTASYNGDSNFDLSTAATTIDIVSGATSLLRTSCLPSSLSPGQVTACTAILPQGATGNVIFWIGGDQWATVPIGADGTATTPEGLSNLLAGTYSIVAYYPGDGSYATGSMGVSLVVSTNLPPPPSFTVSCSPSTFVVSHSTTCTANVTGGATGPVTLSADGLIVAGVGLDSAGSVTFDNLLSSLGQGTHTIQASYLGDQNFASATSSTTVEIGTTQTAPAMTSALNPPRIKNTDQTQIIVHVAGGATGYVDISDDATFITRLPLSRTGDATYAQHVPTDLTDGPYNIYINYQGDANYVPVMMTQILTVFSQTPPPPLPPTTIRTVYSYSITQPNSTSTGYDPAGNITAYTDSVNGQWSSITYDSLNRITGASQAQIGGVPALPWGNTTQQNFCWAYDSFGNRTIQASSNENFLNSQCQVSNTAYLNQFNATYDANNRIATGPNVPAGYSFYSNGNLKDDGVHQYMYDADNRICAVMNNMGGGMVGYLYDAEGQRAAVGNLSSFSCDASSNGFVVTKQYLPGPNGEEMTELDGQGGWVKTNVHAGGELIATYRNDGKGAHYQLADWLGNRRVQTDSNGQVELTCPNSPFGDGLDCVSVNNAMDTTAEHFTGKERDAESGLDYFGARYYGSSMGRFMSPDWSATADPVPYARMDDPQSLNLYAYVGNNPLIRRDGDGHHQECQHSSSTSTDADGNIHVTVREHCTEVPDLLFAGALLGGVGHHYIPQSISSGFNNLTQRFSNSITSGPLVDKWRNYYDNLHRGYNDRVRAIIQQYLRDTGKSMKELSTSDIKAIVQKMKTAGGEIEEFNNRLNADESPMLRNMDEALRDGIKSLGENGLQAIEETIEECEAGAPCIPPI